jgi:hypothetical protein
MGVWQIDERISGMTLVSHVEKRVGTKESHAVLPKSLATPCSEEYLGKEINSILESGI